MSAGPSFLSRAFFEISPSSDRELEQAFLVAVANHRHDQPSGVSTAIPTLKYFLNTRFSPPASSEAN
jgi:hypothetical protein